MKTNTYFKDRLTKKMKKLIICLSVAAILILFGLFTNSYVSSSNLSFRIEDGYIQCRTLNSDWKNVASVKDVISKIDNEDEIIQLIGQDKIKFRKNGDFLQWKIEGNQSWSNLINISELQNNSTNIPYVGENGHWWINDNDTGIIAEDKTEYTIIFDLNGGTISDDFQTEIKVKKGQCIEDLPIPTYANALIVFAGWFTTTNGDITINDGQITKTTPINSNLILKAKWQVKM